MEEDTFREIVSHELVPMLQGTLLDTAMPSTPREHTTSYLQPNRLAVKPFRSSRYRLAIDRSQPFSSQERTLAGQFLDELAVVARLSAGSYETELLKAIPRRVVARHLQGNDLLSSVLERLEDWSSQTYEGQRIVAAIGLNTSTIGSGVPLSELWDQTFGAVLTNGFDTLAEVAKDGSIQSFSQLSSGSSSSTAPYRLGEIAHWSRDSRTAVVLNRHGEILVFRNQALRFARRNGRWLHYIHDANIKRITPPRDWTLRQTIYSSCLDVSFARTGGCIGVIDHAHQGREKQIVTDDDYLPRRSSYKTKLLARLVRSTPFQELDRRARLELLSLDGAVVLDRNGNILSAGAIIEVPAGSTGGGGRTAAARKLSSFGLGVKISEDGTISGFRNGDRVMSS